MQFIIALVLGFFGMFFVLAAAAGGFSIFGVPFPPL